MGVACGRAVLLPEQHDCCGQPADGVKTS